MLNPCGMLILRGFVKNFVFDIIVNIERQER